MDIIDNIQNSLIFYPTKEFFSSPSDEEIEHEEVFVKTIDDETLHGYFLPAKQETKNVVLYLHGNAENVSTWYQACTAIQKHVQANFLIVDYRGYGKSSGKPSIQGVNIDAQAMLDYLILRGFTQENISVYGRSIGGAIAIGLVANNKVKSLVVQSSFTSLKIIAKELYPFIPPALIKDNYWDSLDKIKKVNCPVLISHGDKDELIPVSHSYELYEVALKPKELLILKGAKHNDLINYFNSKYYEILSMLFL